MTKVIVAISILVLIIGCNPDTSTRYTYRTPENIHDGLDVGSLADVNMNPVLIEQAAREMHHGKNSEIHSMLIFKDGLLVFEEYFQGHRFKYDEPGHHGKLMTWHRDSLHRMMSVSKSITSACVGIAVEMGFIRSVHQSIFDYLPDHQHFNTEGREAITIEHLLTMTSGLQGNEWLVPYSNPQNDVIAIYFSEDPITHILKKPMITKPGVIFQYCGSSNFLLAEVLRNATGMNLDEFSGRYLFEPLGIDLHQWLVLNKDVVDGAGGLIITPRDMLKIGVTFLNRGIWNGKKILSESWIEKSAAPFPGNNWVNRWDDHWGMRGYAYSWWTHPFVKAGKRINMYYAAGWGGQFIMVIPDLNMVVVFTGGNYTSHRPSFEILKKYVVPATSIIKEEKK
ncbi:serine hydrolase [candidate division KSB1 bacterium]|nr:serine hydrolase [candidate division KSB1 bacterium]